MLSSRGDLERYSYTLSVAFFSHFSFKIDELYVSISSSVIASVNMNIHYREPVALNTRKVIDNDDFFYVFTRKFTSLVLW